MLREWTKVWLSLVILAGAIFFGLDIPKLITFAVSASSLTEVLLAILGILLYVCLFAGLFGAMWIIWKWMPTLTSKNIRDLKKWLAERHYTLCTEEVRKVSNKTLKSVLGKDGYYQNESEVATNGTIMINYPNYPDAVDIRIPIRKESEVELLENYSYVTFGSYLILFFKHAPGKMLVYKQTPQ